MLTPTQKGNIAEAKLAAAAIELDIGVSRPLCEGQRYDLIFDLHPRPSGYVRTTYDASKSTRSASTVVSSRRAISCRSPNSTGRATLIYV